MVCKDRYLRSKLEPRCVIAVSIVVYVLCVATFLGFSVVHDTYHDRSPNWKDAILGTSLVAIVTVYVLMSIFICVLCATPISAMAKFAMHHMCMEPIGPTNSFNWKEQLRRLRS
jgi:NADH:ubiquinone oxidoreductase subunit 6 (subunit J)